MQLWMGDVCTPRQIFTHASLSNKHGEQNQPLFLLPVNPWRRNSE